MHVPSLWTIELTGPRRSARRWLLASTVLLSATLVVLQFFELHKVGEEGRWHSTITDTDGGPLVASMLVFAIALWATRGRLASGLASAVITFAGGIVGLGFNLVGIHFLSHTVHNGILVWLMLGDLVLVGLGIATLIAELVLHGRERRGLVAPVAPIPTARVVRRGEG